jgi:hypothetical protein
VSIEIKTENPFWDEMRELFATRPKDNPNGLDYLFDPVWSFKAFEKREPCCKKYAWAIPDPASIAFVAQYLHPQAIEIGAGTGYWAWQISQCGVDIMAFDEAPPDTVPNVYFSPRFNGDTPKDLTKTWHPVRQGSAEKLKEHPERALFLCWPPYSDDFALQCLSAYQGHRFVFIGEGDGGCTGDAAFFELLEKEWEEVAEHPIQQWDGIRDHIWVYERSKTC